MAATEQDNEFVTKNVDAGKPETRSLHSNHDQEELEELKETALEKENELVCKNEEARKPET